MKKLNYIGLDVHKKNIVMGESQGSGEAQILEVLLANAVFLNNLSRLDPHR